MIERHKLKNGIRVVTQNNKGSFAASVLVMIKTGSRNEASCNHGMSHFLEHMCFKGTQKRPTFQEIVREVDSMGAFHNAFTGKEYTGYYIKADSKHFENSLDILSDIVFRSTLSDEDMEKERGALLEEVNMYEDDPATFIYFLFDQILYKNHLSAQSSLGDKESISSISRQDLNDYRDKYYRAGNTLLSLVGNLPQKNIEMVNKYFSGVIRGQENYLPDEPNPDYSKQIIIKRKDTEQSHIILGLESRDINDPDRYAVDLLSVILGGNASSGLFSEIREKRGLAYSISTLIDRGFDNGALLIKADLNTAKTEEALKIIINEMRRVAKDLKEDELKRAKEYIEGSMALSEENSIILAEKNAIEDMLGAKALTIDERIKKYHEIGLQDLRKVAENVLGNERLKLAVIGPFKTPEKFVKILES